MPLHSFQNFLKEHCSRPRFVSPPVKISIYGLGMKAAKIGPDLMLSITLPFVSGKHPVLNFGHGQKAKFYFVLSLFSLLPLFLPTFFPLLVF